MRYIKKYESTNKTFRQLSATMLEFDELINLIKSANNFKVKTEVYKSKTKSLKDYLVVFPEIYKKDDIDTSREYFNFINSYDNSYYSWTTLLFISNNYTFIGNTEEEVEFYLAQNKYNL